MSLVQYAVELSSDPNRLYKQICNVAIDMTFIAGCSPAATSFEREDVRMRPFANLTCDY